MTEDGWIPVDQRTLATRFPGVYAVGDVTSVGTPKAGVFAEGAARVVADQLIARIRGEAEPAGYDGTGACWIEFGDHQVGRVDVDFFSTPGHPTGTFTPPSRGDGRREGRVRCRAGARAGSAGRTRSSRAVASTADVRHHVGTRGRRWSSLHEQLETLEVTGC